MARARNIKPGFFSNDRLAELKPLVRLLFAGLWTIADRSGRLEDRPNKIKVEVLPYDTCNIDKMLSELEKAGFLRRYTANGTRYIQINAFTKHQNPHKNEALSTIPAPDEHGASTVQATTNYGTTPADCFNLISDSSAPDSIQTPKSAPPEIATQSKPESPPTAGEIARPVGIAVLLRKLGVTIAGQHPQAEEWAKAGITDAHLTEAVAIARMRKPEPEPIPPNYLKPIIEDLLHPKAPSDDWYKTDQGIDRKGRELKMTPRPSESYSMFKDRIFASLKNQGVKAA